MDISLFRDREISKALSVTELNAFIKKLLDGNKTLSGVSVTGEISNLKDHGSGHLLHPEPVLPYSAWHHTRQGPD